MKEYHIRRHYETKHSEEYSRLIVHFCNDKLKDLKLELIYQQSVFLSKNMESENSVRVLHASRKIAKRCKSFIDKMFIKKHIQCSIDVVCAHPSLKILRVLACLM